MAKVRIEIDMDNAAFEDKDELPRILRSTANKIYDGEFPSVIRDINGNKVGQFEYMEDEN